MIKRDRVKDSGFKCNRCGRPILGGRARYTKFHYNEYLCGSKKHPSYCVQFAEEDREKLTKPH